MSTNEKPLLVVDDDPTNLDLLTRRLRRAGYATEQAASGQEALAIVSSRPVEMVLLDSMMPGLSGIEVLQQLRQLYSPTALPIIMVTALSESARIVEALNFGANDYITKPIDFPVALARIRAQLERKRAEEALRESEERYALAARGANDGLWDWDLRTGRIHYSARWKAMLGYREDEIGDQPEEWLSRVHKEDRPRLEEELAARWGAGSTEFAVELRMRHKDESYRWMLSRGVVLRGSGGAVIRMAGAQTDVTNNKALDPLTGLPNRALFNEKLASCLDRIRTEPHYSFVVLFLDLDRFKVINDSLGHVVGDHLLIHMSRRLREALETQANASTAKLAHLIARLGGDEFAILIENIDDAAACTIAAAVGGAVRGPFLLEGREVFTTASIGIAPGRDTYTTTADILRDADTAMYKAKSQGRARYELFDSEMRAQAIARMELENDLRRAVDNQEFVLYYQPKVRLKTGKITGVEALIRWQHPTKGLIAPGAFIPAAEETGLIVPMGLWALREACSTMRQWHQEFPSDPPLDVSVNLSVRQFRDPGLVEQVAAILKETGLTPPSLQLEVTESVLMDDFDEVARLLEQLKSLGLGLKIDDFGTGYSSLKCLNRLPFDVLKIDRSFVMNMSDGRGTGDVVRTIVSLADNLGMEVVAEGIEGKEEMMRLQSLECDYGQGYYFSPPLSEQNFSDFIRRSQFNEAFVCGKTLPETLPVGSPAERPLAGL